MKLKIRTTEYKSDVEIDTLQDAVAIWNSVRDGMGVRSSQMLRGNGDLFLHGRKIGSLSYNGRAWRNDGTEIIMVQVTR